ncbi:MAG: hypothetical protein LAP40_04540 [Acidobacteriia bacterium]|nr:hypothetical protein [Terriglobia bacterium]
MELAARVNLAVTSICAPNCPGTGLYRNPTAPNLMLQVNSGVAKLVYAPEFFSAVYEQYGDGAIVGLIAHEMGHALDDALGAAWIKSSWTPELRADAWAGCALGKLGQSARDLEGSLAALAKYPSAGHPAWSIRLPVLQAGFTQCGGDAGKFGAALQHTR